MDSDEALSAVLYAVKGRIPVSARDLGRMRCVSRSLRNMISNDLITDRRRERLEDMFRAAAGLSVAGLSGAGLSGPGPVAGLLPGSSCLGGLEMEPSSGEREQIDLTCTPREKAWDIDACVSEHTMHVLMCVPDIESLIRDPNRMHGLSHMFAEVCESRRRLSDCSFSRRITCAAGFVRRCIDRRMHLQDRDSVSLLGRVVMDHPAARVSVAARDSMIRTEESRTYDGTPWEFEIRNTGHRFAVAFVCLGISVRVMVLSVDNAFLPAPALYVTSCDPIVCCSRAWTFDVKTVSYVRLVLDFLGSLAAT